MNPDRQPNIHKQIRTMRRMVLGLVAVFTVILIALLLFIPVDERIIAEGRVSAERDTYLHSPEDGTLKEIFAREGEKVSKGQPVLQLDDTLHQDELAQIEANIEKARSELEFQRTRLERTAKLPLPKEFWHMHEELTIAKERLLQSKVEYQRSSDLLARGLVSKQETERSRLAVEIAESEKIKTQEKLQILEQGLEATILSEARAEIQNAQSALRALEVEAKLRRERIKRCTLSAPEDGFVTLINKRRPGQRITRGEELAHIAHGEASNVEIFAGENQFDRIRTGQHVVMKSKSFDTLRHGYIEGTVLRVALEPEPRPEPVSDSKTQGPLYRVVARVDKTPRELVIGSTVEARIIIQRIPLWKLFLPSNLR
ncbi:MAG: HlyD family secretion protein [Chthoniobacterales bacterium]